MKYLIDTSCLIQAKNTWYAPDIAPSFWSILFNLIKEKNVEIINPVYQEIKNGDKDDFLVEWIKKIPGDLIVNEQRSEFLAAYIEISTYVVANYHDEDKRQAFLGNKIADPWLIAIGMVTGATVVSMEDMVGPDSKKVKIPNICKAMNVNCIKVYDFLRQENIVLGPVINEN